MHKNIKWYVRDQAVRFWNWKYKESWPILPASPVIRGIDKETKIAENQQQYAPLPAIRINDDCGTLITRWKVSFISRLVLLFTGNLYVSYKTFYKPVQPLQFDVWRPDLADPDGFKKKMEVTRTINIEIEKQFISTRNFINEYMTKRYRELMHGNETRVETSSIVDRIQ